MLNYTVTSQEETMQFAKVVATCCQSPMTILLDGELGAGKTTFTKGLAMGLEINALIKSPTYTFIREYTSGTMPLYHMDVYRLENNGGEGLGFEEYFERDGVCVVEWSQFIEEQLPQEYLIIHITRQLENENHRRIVLEPIGKKYENIVIAIEKQLQS
ncbi:tRNA (adenosine(37)-N6)-threonylcarbamoyltransferase complex ATPase subunit type 1 TsaE [Carnobacteriaceae bacterium zg-C25]|nr:tRNA (adenosine(37)-N6)-threonylcarbamoyltransferase complex ATPase subunit type 1 TsaE [Carnobacteriaceae bacterium zg-C25]